MRAVLGIVSAIVATVSLQGCGGAASGDPGARSLPSGQSCQSIRGDLNRLDSKGTQSLVERASNGGKLSPGQRTDVDAYNRLLDQYLGARCHV